MIRIFAFFVATALLAGCASPDPTSTEVLVERQKANDAYSIQAAQEEKKQTAEYHKEVGEWQRGMKDMNQSRMNTTLGRGIIVQ